MVLVSTRAVFYNCVKTESGLIPRFIDLFCFRFLSLILCVSSKGLCDRLQVGFLRATITFARRIGLKSSLFIFIDSYQTAVCT